MRPAVVGGDLSTHRRAAAASEPGRTSARKPKIVVCGGPYGIGNRGDDSILDGIARTIRASGLDADLAAIARVGISAGSTLRAGMALHPMTIAGIARGIAASDLVVIGGGAVLADHAGGSRLRGLVRYPGYPLACASLAAALGKPFVFFAVGVEPIGWGPMRGWTRWACARAALVSVRDRGSAENLAAMGVPREEIVVAADPAITVADSLEDPSPRRAAQGAGSGPLIILGPSFEHDTARVPGYRRFWEEAALRLAEKEGARLLLVEMDVRAGYDEVGTRWIRELLGARPVRFSVLPASLPGREVARAVAAADLVVTARMHLSIFAASCGVPYVSVRRNRKLRDLDEALDWDAGIEMGDLSREKLEVEIARARAAGSREGLRARAKVLKERAYDLGCRVRTIMEARPAPLSRSKG